MPGVASAILVSQMSLTSEQVIAILLALVSVIILMVFIER